MNSTKSLLTLKSVYVLIIFSIILIPSIQAGEILESLVKDTKADQRIKLEDRGIPGSHLLKDQDALLRKQIGMNSTTRLGKARSTAWNFQEGDTKEWYAYNYETTNNYLVAATCRAVGEHCYIFVEDARWDAFDDYVVKQNHVDSLVAYFDSKTPANNSKGIFDTVIGTFGSAPDIDSDPKIIILILDIEDGYDPDGSGGYVAGFFSSGNEFSTADYEYSNECEMFYIDANPTKFDHPGSLKTALSVLSHEFQHMIHYDKDWDEIDFVNEGCSEIAEVVCGFPLRSSGLYFNDTDKYMFGWDDSDDTHLDDYARAALWTNYLYEQLPGGFLKELVKEPSNSIVGIDNAIKTVQSSPERLVKGIFKDWVVANFTQDKSQGSAFGYDIDISGKPSVTHEFINPNVNSFSESVSSYGVDYIQFANCKDIAITFSGSGDVVAVKKGTNTEIQIVKSGVLFEEPDFEEKYTDITFIISNTNNIPKSYSFTSSGTAESSVMELKHDTGDPIGYYPLSEGDSILVQFPGYPGAKIDSIRIAYRHPGPSKLGIWKYNDNSPNSFLGEPLFEDTTLTVAFETFSHPYPVPFPGWVTLDLTSYDISGDEAFVVASAIGDSASTANIMLSTEPDNGNYYSWTRDAEDTRWWVRAEELNISINVYLIRAYLSISGTTVEIEPELPIVPHLYTLSQNYPNPFNPETGLNFSVPQESNVRIDVYDLRGALVKTLVDQNYHAGKYDVRWKGLNQNGIPVSSGVYLAVMQVGGQRITRKMVLLR